MRTQAAGALLVVLTATVVARADEGMWLFSEPPRQQVKDKYGVDLTDSWVEHLRKSSVRMAGGGSGAFVSRDGLVITNHHVAAPWLRELPAETRRKVRNGFQADLRPEEIKVPGLLVRLPWESEDVTRRVHEAIKPDMSLAEAWRARVAVCRALEHESQQKSGLTSCVEALYEGSRYQLIRYKTWSDVRLVFVPEEDVSRAFDFCFLRAYENGQPARIDHFLRWGDVPAHAGDPVFVAGYPARTSRLLQADHLDALYGRPLLLSMKLSGRTKQALTRYAKKHWYNMGQLYEEQESFDHDFLYWWYSLGGVEQTLSDRRVREGALQAALAKDPTQRKVYESAQKRLKRSLKQATELHERFFFLASAHAFNCDLFRHARTLVRLAEETAKPEAERLPEFSAARLADERRALLTPAVIHKNVEEIRLAESLSMFASWAGDDDELAVRILDGATPEERARKLVHECSLDKTEVRKKLAEGGKKALDSFSDPMIALVRLVDEPARQVRRAYEENVCEPRRQAYAAIGAVRAKLKKPFPYPDATGSQRLAFGRIRETKKSETRRETVKDLFDYLQKNKSYLPARWRAARSKLKGDTPILLRNSADGAPGNSGSPVVDRSGHLLGIVARGNSYQNDVVYQEHETDNYAVSAVGILAVLDTVYEARALIKELVGSLAPQNLASTKSKTVTVGSSPAQKPADLKGKTIKLDSDVYRIDQRTFYLPVKLDNAAKGKLRRIHLFVSRDQGKSWKHDRDISPNDHYFTATVREDGMYWYALQLESQDGTKEPADIKKLELSLKVFVNGDKKLVEGGASFGQGVSSTAPGVVQSGYQGPPALPPGSFPAPDFMRIAQRHKGLVPALMKGLEDSDPKVVEAVTDALGNIGVDAIPTLLKALKARDTKIRSAAALALGRMGTAGEAAITALLDAMKDSEVEVRRQAARALAQIIGGVAAPVPVPIPSPYMPDIPRP